MRFRLMATYRGVPYEVGVGPSSSDVVLFAACPPPEELGFEPAPGHWRKHVIRAEVDVLWESRPVGTFHGDPCLVLDDLGDRLHIAYLGKDGRRARELGYWQVDRGVYELLTPRDEATGLTEEKAEKNLPRRAPVNGAQPMPSYPYGSPQWAPAPASSAGPQDPRGTNGGAGGYVGEPALAPAGAWNGTGTLASTGGWNGAGPPAGTGGWNGTGTPADTGGWNRNGTPADTGGWNRNGTPAGAGTWNGHAAPPAVAGPAPGPTGVAWPAGTAWRARTGCSTPLPRPARAAGAWDRSPAGGPPASSGCRPGRSSRNWLTWRRSPARPMRWSRNLTARCACCGPRTDSRSSARPTAPGTRCARSMTRKRRTSTCSASWPLKPSATARWYLPAERLTEASAPLRRGQARAGYSAAGEAIRTLSRRSPRAVRALMVPSGTSSRSAISRWVRSA